MFKQNTELLLDFFLIADVLLFLPGTIVDFVTSDIYKPY